MVFRSIDIFFMYVEFARNLDGSEIMTREVTVSSRVIIESFSNYRSSVIHHRHSTLGLLQQHDDNHAYLGELVEHL